MDRWERDVPGRLGPRETFGEAGEGRPGSTRTTGDLWREVGPGVDGEEGLVGVKKYTVRTRKWPKTRFSDSRQVPVKTNP